MQATAVKPQGSSRLLGIALLGAAIALTLGIYGNVHDPSNQLELKLFFSSTIAMKVWLGTIAAAFALFQALSALRLYGRLGSGEAPVWLSDAHRLSGRLAFLFSLPVAYHCLWSLGFQDTNGRVLMHSLLGCAVYGAFAAKVLIVRAGNLPDRTLPIAGGVMFATLVGAWYTSGLWFIRESGFPAI